MWTRTPRRPPWTGGIEWQAERAKPSDFGYFDYALVNADQPLHATLNALPDLHPVTAEGRWRLYRIGAAVR